MKKTENHNKSIITCENMALAGYKSYGARPAKVLCIRAPCRPMVIQQESTGPCNYLCIDLKIGQYDDVLQGVNDILIKPKNVWETTKFELPDSIVFGIKTPYSQVSFIANHEIKKEFGKDAVGIDNIAIENGMAFIKVFYDFKASSPSNKSIEKVVTKIVGILGFKATDVEKVTLKSTSLFELSKIYTDLDRKRIKKRLSLFLNSNKNSIETIYRDWRDSLIKLPMTRQEYITTVEVFQKTIKRNDLEIGYALLW